jgi:hypothetical protein
VYNLSFFLIHFYRYFSRKVHFTLDLETDVKDYQEMEKEARIKIELKKKKQFDFIDFEAFDKFKRKITGYKKDIKHKKL